MKALATLALFAAVSSPAAAQIASGCESTAFATAFQASFPDEIKERQQLRGKSEAELSRRVAAISDLLSQSKLVDADELKGELDESSPPMQSLKKERERALGSIDAFQKSTVAIPIVVGNDPAKQTRAFCLLGQSALVELAKARAISESISQMKQDGLLRLAAKRDVEVPEAMTKLRSEPSIACNSPDGELAAKERVETQLSAVRMQERKRQSELDAQAKQLAATKGWDKQRIAAIYARIPTLPQFIELEEEKRPLTKELTALIQGGSLAGTDRPNACSWPDALIGILGRIGEINQRQYALMARELNEAN